MKFVKRQKVAFTSGKNNDIMALYCEKWKYHHIIRKQYLEHPQVMLFMR